jgi:hypothetical protein
MGTEQVSILAKNGRNSAAQASSSCSLQRNDILDKELGNRLGFFDEYTAMPYGRDNTCGTRCHMDKRNAGQKIVDSLREIKSGGGRRYRFTTPEYIRQIRTGVGVSQANFARMLGISLRTLQDW